MTRVVAVVALVSIVLVAVGVGFYDWRAGLIVLGVLSGAVAIWTLNSQE